MLESAHAAGMRNEGGWAARAKIYLRILLRFYVERSTEMGNLTSLALEDDVLLLTVHEQIARYGSMALPCLFDSTTLLGYQSNETYFR